jgi:hypothetical protein
VLSATATKPAVRPNTLATGRRVFQREWRRRRVLPTRRSGLSHVRENSAPTKLKPSRPATR